MMEGSLSTAPVASGAGQAGTSVLRILQALAALCKPAAPEAGQVGQSLHDVACRQLWLWQKLRRGCTYGSCPSSRKKHRLSSDGVQETTAVAGRAQALEQVAAKLGSLWASLSGCLIQIAAGLESSTQANQDATSRILPAGAAQACACICWLSFLCASCWLLLKLRSNTATSQKLSTKCRGSGPAPGGGLLRAVRRQDSAPAAATARHAARGISGAEQGRLLRAASRCLHPHARQPPTPAGCRGGGAPAIPLVRAVLMFHTRAWLLGMSLYCLEMGSLMPFAGAAGSRRSTDGC